MAAALVVPVSSLALSSTRDVVLMPPSAITQHSPRHGRSRGASIRGAGKVSARGRRYSVIEDPDVALYKALSFVLKRSVSEDKLDSDLDEESEKQVLVTDEKGWVNAQCVLEHPRIGAFGVGLNDIQRVIASKPGRLSLRQQPSSDANNVASYDMHLNTPRRDSLASVPAKPLEGDILSPETDGLPDFVVYETTYSRYPLILAWGAIRRAAGTAQTVFVAAPVADDGSLPAIEADVGIWIHLPSAMNADTTVVWQRNRETGVIFTQAKELPKCLWKKAVARRLDIGVLLENGLVKKEIPTSLRGKGAKGKTKKGKGSLKGRTEDASGNASEA